MFNFLRMAALFPVLLLLPVRVLPVLSAPVLSAPVLAADGVLHAPTPSAGIDRIAAAWAELKYQAADDPQRRARTLALERETAGLLAASPSSPDLMYWRANVLCFAAELAHSTKSLAMVREARDLLLKAEQLQPQSSAIKSSLGSIYYEVPGWPISFGNNGKAQRYLAQAVALDPDGMDANFFMGDFLLQRGKAAQALPYLEKAASAGARLPASVLVDGRRREIDEALSKARKKAR
jgi:tetratricopeptide (TPR) repeat protein